MLKLALLYIIFFQFSFCFNIVKVLTEKEEPLFIKAGGKIPLSTYGVGGYNVADGEREMMREGAMRAAKVILLRNEKTLFESRWSLIDNRFITFFKGSTTSKEIKYKFLSDIVAQGTMTVLSPSNFKATKFIYEVKYDDKVDWNDFESVKAFNEGFHRMGLSKLLEIFKKRNRGEKSISFELFAEQIDLNVKKRSAQAIIIYKIKE